MIKVDLQTGKTLKVDVCRQVSGICVYREIAIKHYKERIAMVEKEGYNRNMGYEPGTHNRIKWKNEYKMGEWQSNTPMLDIRHNSNLSPNRWSKDLFRDKRNCEGWTEGTIDNISGWKDLRKTLNMYSIYDKDLLIWKDMNFDEVRNNLELAYDELEKIDEKDFNKDNLEKVLRDLMEISKIKAGELLYPLRVALTGLKASPSPFDIAGVLGKEKTLKKIRIGLKIIG